MSRARMWCFTDHSLVDPVFDQDTMHYLKYQVELCPKTDKLHLQGFVQFKEQLRMERVKALFPKAHLEVCHGTAEENDAYCGKEETRAWPEQEPVVYGTLKVRNAGNSGQRNDLINAMDTIAKKRKWSEVLLDRDMAVTTARHLKWAKEVFNASRPKPTLELTLYEWQAKLVEELDGTPDTRKIIWYVDKDGANGKSTLARWLIANKEAIVLEGKKADCLYGYNGERIVVFDLSRSTEEYTPYDTIEKIKNGVFFNTKYESGMRVFDQPHVVVFSNFWPDQEKMSSDRWDIRTEFKI